MSQRIEAEVPQRARDVLMAFAQQLDVSGAELAQQTAAATALDPTPTWIDFRIPDGVPKGPWRNGPLRLQPDVLGLDDDDCIGLIIVWIEDGMLSSMEQAWHTDDPPTDWPTVDQLHWVTY